MDPATHSNNAKHDAVDAQATDYIPLDPRVIQLWRIGDLIGFSLLLIPALIAALVGAHWLTDHPTLGFIPWGFLILLAGWWIIWYPPRAYRAWGYRIDDKVLETRSGVWWRVIRFLPLSRLQHVDLRRGPIERAHGLASLTLHTAGTQEASLSIPGLDAEEAVRLRDRLMLAEGDDAV